MNAAGVSLIDMDHNPKTDYVSTHKWIEAAGILALMGKPPRRAAREILSENVRKLIGYTGPGERSAIPQAFLAGKGASQSTIWRIINAEAGSRLETLDAIAAYFQLPCTWQLLVEHLEQYPRTGPELKSAQDSKAEFLRQMQKLAGEMLNEPEQAQKVQEKVEPLAVPQLDRVQMEVLTRLTALLDAHGLDKLTDMFNRLGSAGPQQESVRAAAPTARDRRQSKAKAKQRQKHGAD